MSKKRERISCTMDVHILDMLRVRAKVESRPFSWELDRLLRKGLEKEQEELEVEEQEDRETDVEFA